MRAENEPDEVWSRLVGFQANAAAFDPGVLDNASELKVSDIGQWARLMARLHCRFGLKILGGCCGTGAGHLERLLHELGYPVAPEG